MKQALTTIVCGLAVAAITANVVVLWQLNTRLTAIEAQLRYLHGKTENRYTQ